MQPRAFCTCASVPGMTRTLFLTLLGAVGIFSGAEGESFDVWSGCWLMVVPGSAVVIACFPINSSQCTEGASKSIRTTFFIVANMSIIIKHPAYFCKQRWVIVKHPPTTYMYEQKSHLCLGRIVFEEKGCTAIRNQCVYRGKRFGRQYEQ